MSKREELQDPFQPSPLWDSGFILSVSDRTSGLIRVWFCAEQQQCSDPGKTLIQAACCALGCPLEIRKFSEMWDCAEEREGGSSWGGALEQQWEKAVGALWCSLPAGTSSHPAPGFGALTVFGGIGRKYFHQEVFIWK